MDQKIEIKAFDNEENQLGTFIIQISLSEEQEKNLPIDLKEEYPIDESITLYNVPVVDKIDDEDDEIIDEYDYITPICYYNKYSNNANIFLLEETEYKIFFNPCKQLNGLDYFHTLKTIHKDNTPLKLAEGTYSGFLNFGSYVGKTFLDIFNHNSIVFKIPIEVRSKKIHYNKQYDIMIGDLSRYSSGLIFDLKSPLYQPFNFDKIDENASYELFMLLEYLFRDEHLPSTVEYLSRNLYSVLENKLEEVPISFASNINPNELINAFSDTKNLYKLEEANNEKLSKWSNKTKSFIPNRINEIKYADNIDVPENRFYKDFLIFIENLIHDLLKNVSEGNVKDKLLDFEDEISFYLSQRYFKDISRMDYAPLNSQVIKKKEGYRDILEYFLMFELGLRMDWTEATEKIKGYEKKLFELYEFWCYFKLVKILEEITETELKFNDIFDDEDKFNIRLKKNDNGAEFKYYVNDKDVLINLKYNKDFKKSDEDFPTYSVLLTPDYSLIFHIEGHRYIIHFDAKYKFNIKRESYQNEDIVKMHSYKDAIIDTIGAYILYPNGKKPEVFFEGGYDSLESFFRDEWDGSELLKDKCDCLKSVGAFPLTPEESHQGSVELTKFITTILDKLTQD